jgi:hypothetical protein
LNEWRPSASSIDEGFDCNVFHFCAETGLSFPSNFHSRGSKYRRIMSESLSKEALLEYVKKQKQKIKKLEQELTDEKEKAAAAPKFSAIPDLTALQDEISGGISSFFGITPPSATTETPADQNKADVRSEDVIKNILATKDAELTSSLLREKKLKALIKVKIKEVDDKEKEILQFKALLAAEKDERKPDATDCSTASSSNQLASLQQEIDELKARLKKEQRENGENSTKSETAALKAGTNAIESHFGLLADYFIMSM